MHGGESPSRLRTGEGTVPFTKKVSFRLRAGGRTRRPRPYFSARTEKYGEKMRQRGTPNRRHACGRDITGLRRGDFKGDQSPLSNPLASRRGTEISLATTPAGRALNCPEQPNRAGALPRRATRPAAETHPPRRSCRGADYHTKPEPSFSGSGLERRRNGMSLLSHLCGSKGYGICADEAAVMLEAGTILSCCAELALPALP